MEVPACVSKGSLLFAQSEHTETSNLPQAGHGSKIRQGSGYCDSKCDGKGKRNGISCMGVTVSFSKEAPLFAQLHVDDVVVSENCHESRLRRMRAQIACKQLPTVPPVHRAKLVYIPYFHFFIC